MCRYIISFAFHNPNEKKSGSHLVPHRAVFRPLVQNDLSLGETVVGFVAGLNFPEQGQRSDLSGGSGVNEQRRSETAWH